MNKDIQLFIDGKEIEWNSIPKIEFTYQTTDYTNPTVVKNSFSKTVTIDGTDTNNKIFNEIWLLDRCQDEGFELFNPSQKVPFELFRNGEIVEKGYAKLDSIDREGYKVGYNITLYGGLGSFFYSLDYDIGSDKEKSLADLNFMGTSSPEDEFTFEINKNTVHDAWRRCGQSGNTGSWKKYDYINFAPCYNGFPENFDYGKCLMNTHGMNNLAVRYTNDSGLQYGTFPMSLTDSNGTAYTPDNGYIYGELSRDMTEWETRDLRSYLQRPVLSIKGLFEALGRPENNGGYYLDLDPDFFGSGDNPYYDKAWVTLPMIDSSIVTEETVDEFTWSARTGEKLTFDRGREMTFELRPASEFITTPDRLEFEVEIHANFSGSPSATYLYNSIANSGYFGDLYCNTYFQIYIDRDTNLSLYPNRPNAVCGSNKFVLATKLNGQYWNAGTGNAFDTPYKTTATEWLFGKWQRVSGSDYKWVMDDGSDTVKITIDTENINRIPMICYFSKNICNYSNPDNVYQYTGMAYSSQTSTSLNDALSKGYTYLFREKPVNVESNAVFKGGDVTRSFQTITKRILFGGLSVTPCDWLLSYCKLFGLYIYKHKTEDIIYIRMRKNFYDDEVVDISDRIDRGQKYNITPLTFDSKWYTFNYSEGDSKVLNEYKNLYNQDFGKQLVNTNYNFDSESVDLLDGNVFNNGVTVLEKSLFFNNKYDQKNNLIPTVLYDWVKFKYYALETTYETNMALPQGATVTTLNPYMPDEFYDITPKLQLHDRDNGATDGEGILLFFNGLKSTGKVSYWLTDDLQMMFKESDNPCWLITQKEWDIKWQNRIAIEEKTLPDFERYVIHQPATSSRPVITCDWDFGRTKELYVPYYRFDIDRTPTVYENFWQAYINDLYSVDTRKVDVYVNLDTNSVYDALKRFYWFDNSIWVMTKVENYDIALDRSTKCSFTKVNDMESYLHSVTFDDFFFNFRRIDGSGNIPYTGTTDELTATFVIDSSENWTVFTGDHSIAQIQNAQTANAISGTAGSNIIVQAVFFPNTTNNERTVLFYGVNMATNSFIQIYVTQDAWKNTSHLFLGSTMYYVPKISTGMTFQVLVYSSDPWTCSYNASWVHSQSNSGQAGDYTVWNFTCDNNNTVSGNERRAEVWFTNGTDTDSFIIVQSGNTSGSIEQYEQSARYTVNSTGGTFEYLIICDTNWVLMPSGSSSSYTSCVDYTVDSVATSGHSSYITVAANDSPVSRNIFFYMEYDGIIQKPKIIQLPLVQNGSGNTIINESSSATANTTTLHGNMPWSAYTNDSFITVSTTSGTSADTRLEYSVSANAGGYRVGYIFIDYTDEYGCPCSEVFEIRQGGNEQFSVSPTAITASYTGGTYMVGVSASTPFTASTTTPWIAMVGSKLITAVPFSVEPNSGDTARVGFVNFNNGSTTKRTYVLQESKVSKYPIYIKPSSASFVESGGTGAFTVYCQDNWHISSGTGWVVLNAYSGNGNTIVSYTVSPNTDASRDANIVAYLDIASAYSATTRISQVGSNTSGLVITYTTEDGNPIKIKNNDAFGGAVILSNTYENGVGTLLFDRPVTAITGVWAYDYHNYGKDQLQGIILPSTIESIGTGAFSGMGYFTGMTIPNSVVSMGTDMFFNSGMWIGGTDIIYSSGMTTVPSRLGEQSIKSFNYNGANVSTIEASAFTRSKLTGITIPEGVQTVGNWAYYLSTSATSLYLPKTIRSIGRRVFEAATGLTSITASSITPPTIEITQISGSFVYNYGTFYGISNSGTFYYPNGADYSSWQNDAYLSGWTFVQMAAEADEFE